MGNKICNCGTDLKYLVGRCMVTLEDGQIKFHEPTIYYCPECNKVLAMTKDMAIHLLQKIGK